MAKDLEKTKTPEEIEQERLEAKNAKKARHLDSRPFAEISSSKILKKSKKKKRMNRSVGGDIALFIFLAICGIGSILPLYMIVMNAFKPLDELLLFPPKLYVMNPTLDNFSDLGVVLGTSLVPLSRYLFNTLLVTVVGAGLHIILSSMAAFVLSKYDVPGKVAIFLIIQYSICFPAAVTGTPNYIIMNWLGLIDTHWSIILPTVGTSMGLFLMKQFMDQIPNDLVESGKLDGAGEFTIYLKIIMPLVKPAWVTIIILDFKSLWATYGSTTIYREDLKMLAYAINQIASAGVSRTGTLYAVQLIMISVPIAFFIIQQSNVLETMAHSGMK